MIARLKLFLPCGVGRVTGDKVVRRAPCLSPFATRHLSAVKRSARCLLVLLAFTVWGTVVPSSAQTVTLSTNNIYFNIGALGQNPASVQSVSIQGLYNMAYNGTFYPNWPITAGTYSQPSITNGTVWFTNVICGVPFDLKIYGYSTIDTNFTVPSSANPDSSGGINAGQYLGHSQGYQLPFWYASSVVSNYNFTITAGAGATNVVPTNGPSLIANQTLWENTNFDMGGLALQGFQNSSNLSYTLAGNGSNNATTFFQVGSNLTGLFGLNGSNNVTLAFQNGSNLSYTLSGNGSNNAAARSLSSTNFTLATAAAGSTNDGAGVALGYFLSGSNLTGLFGLNGSNNAAARSLSSTNFTLATAAAGSTNDGAGLALGYFLSGSNLTGLFGLNGSNNAAARSLSNTNFTLATAAAGSTNDPSGAANGAFQSASNLTFLQVGPRQGGSATLTNIVASPLDTNAPFVVTNIIQYIAGAQIAMSSTNDPSGAANAAFQNGSNLSYTLAGNGSNNATTFFQVGSNLMLAKVLAGSTNDGAGSAMAVQTSLLAALIATNAQTTNGQQTISSNLFNQAIVSLVQSNSQATNAAATYANGAFQSASNLTFLQVGPRQGGSATLSNVVASVFDTNAPFAVSNIILNLAGGVAASGSTNDGAGVALGYFQSGSNLTGLFGLNGSNNAAARSASSTNFTLATAAAGSTNDGSGVALGYFLSGSNLTGLFGLNGSNNAAARSLSNTNFTLAQVAAGSTNDPSGAANGAFQSASNLTFLQVGPRQGGSSTLSNVVASVFDTNAPFAVSNIILNLAAGVAASGSTNDGAGVALGYFLSGSNLTGLFGLNGSNNAAARSLSSTNFTLAQVAAALTSLTNAATAISNNLGFLYPATVANSNLALYVQSLVENNTNFLVSIGAGSALANSTNVLKSINVWTNITGASYISNAVLYVSGVAFYGSASGYPNGPWTNIGGSLPVPSTYFMPKGTIGGTGILITNFYGINTIQIPGIVTNGSNPYFGNVQATNVTATNFYGNFVGTGSNLTGIYVSATNIAFSVSTFNGLTNSIVTTPTLITLNIGVSNIVATNLLGQGGTSGQVLTYNNLTGLANWSNAPSGGGSGNYIGNLAGYGTNTFLTNSPYIQVTNISLIGSMGNGSYVPVKGDGNIVIGGSGNTVVNAPGGIAMIGGGSSVIASSQSAIIGGGANTINPGDAGGAGSYNFIGGGGSDFISDYSGSSGIIGGVANSIRSTGGGDGGNFIGGGNHNTITNSAWCFTEGNVNVISNSIYSVALGNNSAISNANSFVWCDGSLGAYGSNVPFWTTATNQFLIHALGGFGFNTNNPGFGNFSISGNLLVNGANAVGNGSDNNTSHTNLTIVGITLPLTNTAPANAVTPVIWLVITNSGNVYKVPAYQ